MWARQQLIDNGHTVWREDEWVGLIEQQHGFGYANLARLVPWDQRYNYRSTQRVTGSQTEAR